MITKEQEEIYKQVKEEKKAIENIFWNKRKKEIIKSCGQVPIFLYLLFSSISISFIITFLSFFINNSSMNLLLGNYTIIIFFGFVQSVLSLTIFLFGILFIDLYHKSVSLNDNDRK
jgi:hypothetical protein